MYNPAAADSLLLIIRKLEGFAPVLDSTGINLSRDEFEEWISVYHTWSYPNVRKIRDWLFFLSAAVPDVSRSRAVISAVLGETLRDLYELLQVFHPKASKKCKAPVQVFRVRNETRINAEGKKYKVRIDPEEEIFDNLVQRGILQP